MEGALIAGPVVIGDMKDTLDLLSDESMRSVAEKLPLLQPSGVTHLSELLAASAAYVSETVEKPSSSFVFEQEKLLKAVYAARERRLKGENPYESQLEYEKKLSDLIASRDRSGAQALLNEVLGHIYFTSDFDPGVVKTRALELAVVISRAAIKAGADSRELFLYNSENFSEFESITSLDELSIRLGVMLHRFISYAFDFRQVKHSDAVYKTIEYIRKHCGEKITLGDIAKNVCLSRSYISAVFKEETGKSVVRQINEIRIEKSKKLLSDKTVSLSDIAGLCGFEDQSYFTRVFRRTTGVTPKKFRDGVESGASAKSRA
jgi:YesN/AraC family two-component response regulator